MSLSPRLALIAGLALALGACSVQTTSAPVEATAPAAAAPASGASAGFAPTLNAFRASQGLAAATADAELEAAARAHAADMLAKGYFSHDGQDGSTPGSRARAAGCGWTAVAENIAQSRRGPEGAMEFWVNSPGHRANMLNPAMARFGLGQAGDLMVLVLANRC